VLGPCGDPNNPVILLMEEILHQLRLVVYPIMYKVLYIPGPRWCRISSINLWKLVAFLVHQKHQNKGFLHGAGGGNKQTYRSLKAGV